MTTHPLPGADQETPLPFLTLTENAVYGQVEIRSNQKRETLLLHLSPGKAGTEKTDAQPTGHHGLCRLHREGQMRGPTNPGPVYCSHSPWPANITWNYQPEEVKLP